MQDLINAVTSTLDALDSSLTSDQVYQAAKVKELYAIISELESDILSGEIVDKEEYESLVIEANQLEDKIDDIQSEVDESIDTLNEINAELSNSELTRIIDKLQNINF